MTANDNMSKGTKTPNHAPAVDIGVEGKTFILTDGCMWEKNKKEGTKMPHAIEVVDMETGEIRYIVGGSKIKLVEGAITMTRQQDSYNKKP